MKNKKGAIELSMTTIIVIVIGVTLLILGLAWVRGLFAKTSVLTDQAFATAEKMIQENMGSSDKFYVSGLKFDVGSGESVIVHVGVQSFGKQDEIKKYSLSANSDSAGCDAKTWFTLPDAFEMRAGDKMGVPVEVKVPKGTEPGTTCPFTIKALEDGKLYGSQPIIVKVKEE